VAVVGAGRVAAVAAPVAVAVVLTVTSRPLTPA
jgi:hypothetical protein